MKISDIKIFQYDIPLKMELIVHGNKINNRRGFIVQITDENKMTGYGEISPLPGVSSETSDEAGGQLLMVKDMLLDQAVPGDMDLFPSVRFGIETALLILKTNSGGVTMAGLISSNYARRVYVNGLLSGKENVILKQAGDMIKEGFRTVKLKVGFSDLEEDISKARAVCRVIRGKAVLRLDANRSWTFEQAVQFIESIGCENIEYIEEPFCDTGKITEFYKKTGIPVALDESVKELGLDAAGSIEGVTTIIVKPTVFGGVEQLSRCVETLKQYGIKVVLSSAFETGLGIAVLVNLAAGLTDGNTAGLDTLKWFEHDILNKKVSITRGYIEPSNIVSGTENINFDLLKEIYS